MGKERTHLPSVGNSCEQGYSPLPRRLGPPRRPRLALLEESNARIRRPPLLTLVQFQKWEKRRQVPFEPGRTQQSTPSPVRQLNVGARFSATGWRNTRPSTTAAQ